MKRVSLIMCTLFLALLCACGTSSDTSGTLTICADGNGLNESLLGPILAEFESQNPGIELEVNYLPVSNSQDSAAMEERAAALTRTRTELMSGEGADIYLFFNRAASGNYDNYMVFPDLERQIMGGIFHDLDFLFENSGFDAEEYVPALQKAGVYEGKSYVLPLSYDVPALVGVEETLQNSGFDEEAAKANTAAYVEQLLALSEEQRPYLTVASPYLLLDTPSVSPVSVQDAQIQLNTDVWQESLQLNRRIIEECGTASDDDFFASLEFDEQIENGAVFLASPSTSTPGYYLRMLEDSGYTGRLLPIPNENGGLTMMPYITAAVSAGCENTDAAAELLLFLLGDTVQGSGELESSGGTSGLFITGGSWPVRLGCAVKTTEQITLTYVSPGEISETLKADLESMQSRVDSCRLAGSYDANLYTLTEPYLNGTQSWEECYANIEKEWSYLDE